MIDRPFIAARLLSIAQQITNIANGLETGESEDCALHYAITDVKSELDKVVEATDAELQKYYKLVDKFYTQEELWELWKAFGDTPVNEDEDETIDEHFHIWSKGTPREVIWSWFDEKLAKGLGLA